MKTPVFPKNNWQIVDSDGKHICLAGTTEQRDLIIQALNSHEKLVEATKALVEDRNILQQDEGIFACQCLAKAPDDITEPPLCCYCLGKQALEEAEKQ